MFRIEIATTERKVHQHDYWLIEGLPSLIFEVEGKNEEDAIDRLIEDLGFENSDSFDFYAEPLSNSYDLITE
jgi:hypothetical protein